MKMTAKISMKSDPEALAALEAVTEELATAKLVRQQHLYALGTTAAHW